MSDRSAPNPEPAPTRDDLVARLNLMETMIAEGRQATARFGWIFVLWGLVNLAGLTLEWEHPGHDWTWPLVIGIGVVLQFGGMALRRGSGRICHSNTQARAVSAIWGMMGVTLILYVFTSLFTHYAWGHTYFAAILMTVGLAHAASAIVLRWPAQIAVATLWWAGGLTCFFVSDSWFLFIFGIEMFFGMVVFGLYGMWLERRPMKGATA